MRNTGLDEAQAGIKIARRNINNLRYADDTTLMAESKELKSLLMKVKEESEKVHLKLSIYKMNLTQCFKSDLELQIYAKVRSLCIILDSWWSILGINGVLKSIDF